ncbi:tyrosine-type recombinase/integrase, partial [bacterium]|nr:tyrosine-type recombinase/integrase [bacterium]
TSSSIRTIYLPDELKQNLKKIKNEQNKNKFKYGEKYKKEYRNNKEIDYIFKKEDGSKITYNTLLNTIKKIQKIDKNFHFHRLRHSFCSQYLKNGVDVLHVSKILGHASVNTTLKIYSHIKKEDILEIMKSTKIL